MPSMLTMVFRGFASVAVGVVALVAVACGGGGDNGGGSGAPRLTDPASVPVAERVEGDQTYILGENQVSAPSGVNAPLPTPASSGSGGGETSGDGANGTGGGSDSPSGETYTVQSGDTCGGIASQMGITVEALMSANPEIDADCQNLNLDQVLQIPATSGDEPSGDDPDADDDEPAQEPDDGEEPADDEPDTPSGSGGQEHVVQAGENCLSIAGQYGVDVDEMVALNGLDCNRLQIDQVITIP